MTASTRSGQGTSALDRLSTRLSGDTRAVKGPDVSSFREFLETVGRVPIGSGEYGPYTFAGREPLIEPVETIDRILGSADGQPMKDATLALAGGAQFGKTVMELHLGAYTTAVLFRNWGFYLPDDLLVQGVVDTKFRPDIVDQLDWFADMTQVGKAVNKSGKAVNRKGAFMVTDGQRSSNGMIMGLNKVPTTFSFDIATLDEVDDIKEKMEKFVRGRMTNSKLRALVKIGTQRVAGRGMHKAWKDGSQGVCIHTCPSCGHEHNLEEEWPRILRLQISDTPSPSDPFLTFTGDFRQSDTGETVATHHPKNRYRYACVKCAATLDRSLSGFHWEHRRPERLALQNFSFRISQFGCAAIDEAQIVADWVRAVADPEAMTFFNCDRKAMPESTAQRLSPEVLDRSRKAAPFDMAPRVSPDCSAYAGLDTGRQCWFLAREVESPAVKRLLHAEKIPVGNVVERAVTLCQLFGISVLFIDQAPETDAARTIALKLNGLESLRDFPKVPDNKKDAYIQFPGGLRWNGHQLRWEGLKCAVVAFTKRGIGAGIEHDFDQFEKNGQQMFVPLIKCNRFESIDGFVREFLTPLENVTDVIHPAKGQPFVRMQPAMRLPRKTLGSPLILETLESHLLVGSEREEKNGELGDYVDKCENHLTLAGAYARLAESIGGSAKATPAAAQSVHRDRSRGRKRKASVL